MSCRRLKTDGKTYQVLFVLEFNCPYATFAWMTRTKPIGNSPRIIPRKNSLTWSTAPEFAFVHITPEATAIKGIRYWFVKSLRCRTIWKVEWWFNNKINHDFGGDCDGDLVTGPEDGIIVGFKVKSPASSEAKSVPGSIDRLQGSSLIAESWPPLTGPG